MSFLPVKPSEVNGEVDFVLVTGDAYVDHPSFGTAIISRVLESEGFSVAIIPQPNWQDCKDFMRFGKPKLGFLVNSGNIDSMVNKYTAAKKLRRQDSFSPGGKIDMRPERAVIVYCNRIREAYKNVPVIIGGIEASLRRLAHYDYWDNKVRRSVLFDSRADLLIYGMGERPIVEIANRLKNCDVKDITDVRGTCYISNEAEDADIIPSYEEVKEDKTLYAEATAIAYGYRPAKRKHNKLAQKHGDKYLVENPSAIPLTEEEMDKVYSLPYMRESHPMYDGDGGVPALNEIKFSITATRGCYGGCNFCALRFHQGKSVSARSGDSIVKEAKCFARDKEFKGYIHDVGGATANFVAMPCTKKEPCKNKSCLSPNVCKNLIVTHKKYLSTLRRLRSIDGVKKVFIRSGIRYDYLLADKDTSFFKELCAHHISGQLRVAPEHVSDNVLALMGKPSSDVYNRFVEKFNVINKKTGKEQYVVPYLMSSHPGSTIHNAIELAQYLKKNKLHPEQVQDFYPTPASISTCMYYTGINPIDMSEVYVARDQKEKAMQRALLQYDQPGNYKLVYEALVKAGREDLIGNRPDCLIRERKDTNGENSKRQGSQRKNQRGTESRGRGAQRKGR
ncbi:MAG: YgiQ family radical SAM protein [Eubacteriales bacterium]|nr:YgiQ family radical SAM protein [Eubacteriales bacterium]